MIKDRKYIILRRNTKTGEISAYSEYYCAFNSERVTLFYPEKIHCQENQANSPNQREWLKIRRRVLWLNAVKPDGKEYEYKAFRAFSKNCPIEIDFTERKKIILNEKRGNQNKKGSKLEYYNLPFKVIPGKW